MDDRPTQVALFRYSVIARLLAPDLSTAERVCLRQEILARMHLGPGESRGRKVSARTLRRWQKDYREKGFAGLRPRARRDQGRPRRMDPAVLEKAVALREEVPERSVRQIVEILTLDPETPVQAGELKLSTLARHLRRLGKTRSLLKLPKQAYRRYEKDRPNAQWQSDVFHGPFLPDPQGEMRRTYLIAFLDDHSRLVPHGQFYWAEDLSSLLDCFKKAILKRGIPARVYCDNGVIYQSHQFQRICAELGILHLSARPYSPQGKGKIERFWQGVDGSFLPELRAYPVGSLDELNRLFGAWLEQGYHHRVNRETAQTPSARFAQALEDIRLADPARVAHVFLWQQERRVDKTGVVSLEGNRYEVDSRLALRKVQLRYDPF
ncbi:MAG: DDE-type integrase/transposase/recombinase, partial [bacterium]|nr:DDE-type integrase/transposase/recombinase [bacterium]